MVTELATALGMLPYDTVRSALRARPRELRIDDATWQTTERAARRREPGPTSSRAPSPTGVPFSTPRTACGAATPGWWSGRGADDPR